MLHTCILTHAEDGHQLDEHVRHLTVAKERLHRVDAKAESDDPEEGWLQDEDGDPGEEKSRHWGDLVRKIFASLHQVDILCPGLGDDGAQLCIHQCSCGGRQDRGGEHRAEWGWVDASWLVTTALTVRLNSLETATAGAVTKDTPALSVNHCS